MDGDIDRALKKIKATFDSHRNDRSVTENGFGLLKQILHEGTPVNPPETKLPGELSSLKISVKRELLDGEIRFSFNMKAGQRTAAKVTHAKLAYFNGEVLLDSKTGLGKVTTEIEENPTFRIARHDLPSPPPEGPVEIFITFDNGHKWHGWAPLVDMVASTSPVILYPAPNQNIPSGTPTLRWRDFTSPEYRPGIEKRGFWAAIYDDAFKPWTDLVTKDSWHSDGLPMITVPAEKELPNGNYGFTVHYTEGRRFGDIKLNRFSAAYRRFNVQK